MRTTMMLALIFGMSAAVGCTTSRQAQQNALVHQQNSDEAAKNGQYGIAGAEQRKAQDQHHKAVKKAIDEGNPIPEQTRPGDKAPPTNQ